MRWMISHVPVSAGSASPRKPTTANNAPARTKRPRFVAIPASETMMSPLRKYRNFRKGDIIVSLAGIATNLGLFVLAGALFAVVGFLGDALPALTGTWEIIQRMLVYGMLMNVWLAFFNLLPIPPLDGSHVFKYVLPPGAGLKYRQLYAMGYLPIVAFLLFVKLVGRPEIHRLRGRHELHEQEERDDGQVPHRVQLPVLEPRPGRQDVLEDVAAVQRRDREQVEEREPDVHQHPVDQHTLDDLPRARERRQRIAEEADHGEQRARQNEEAEIRRDPRQRDDDVSLAEVPQLPQGRHHRLAGGDRDESRPLRSGGRVVRRGRLPRRCAAGAHGHVGDHPAHAGLRDADERLARVLQPAPDPAAGRQPRLQVRPAARGGAQVPAAVRDGVPAHRRVPLVREARAGRAGGVSLAGPRADARRAQRRRAVRRVRRSLPPVTNPALTTRDQNGFVIELEQFSGPLDLLLHLIREDEVDITDLPIAKIADQFLAVINELGLNQAADYLEMAARLLRIKAQLLLPRRVGDDEWEDPRAELVRRLLEYQQIRELVDWLGQAAARRAEQFGRD